jgi:hypothetical protein
MLSGKLKKRFNSKKWSEKINLSEPIDISYESNGYGLKFYLEDGHHRYFAAKTLNKTLNVNLEIKANPITKITNKLGYDEFHRCLFKQIKQNEKLIKVLLRNLYLMKKCYP